MDLVRENLEESWSHESSKEISVDSLAPAFMGVSTIVCISTTSSVWQYTIDSREIYKFGGRGGEMYVDTATCFSQVYCDICCCFSGLLEVLRMSTSTVVADSDIPHEVRAGKMI